MVLQMLIVCPSQYEQEYLVTVSENGQTIEEERFRSLEECFNFLESCEMYRDESNDIDSEDLDDYPEEPRDEFAF